MDKTTLLSLEKVNQLALTDAEKESVLAFFEAQDASTAALDAIDTEGTERMVHVLPILTVVREDVAKKVKDELAPKYADRSGGYTRITRIGTRRGDAAEVAVIELV